MNESPSIEQIGEEMATLLGTKLNARQIEVLNAIAKQGFFKSVNAVLSWNASRHSFAALIEARALEYRYELPTGTTGGSLGSSQCKSRNATHILSTSIQIRQPCGAVITSNLHQP